jgi:hypothetical protein
MLVAPKFPEEIMFVTMDQLPKTKTGKYIRIGLSDELGVTARLETDREAAHPVSRSIVLPAECASSWP